MQLRKQPEHGTPIKLPKMPKLPGGTPENRSDIEWRSHRISYDWKAFNPEQLLIMEDYWDEFIALYDSLLPSRYRKNPKSFKGINLGTFNGSFQKAWVRLGYNMYGVELKDTVNELKEYNCEGEQDSFFNLSNISENTFDFTVMDRAYFLVVNQGYEFDEDSDQYKELASSSGDSFQKTESDESYKNPDRGYQKPPFFDKIFKVLKNDGVFLGIFYQHWPSTVIRELFTYGKVTLWPISRAVPFLAICIDRREKPTLFLEPEDIVEGFREEFQSNDIDEALSSFSSHPYIGKLQVHSSSLVKFHYLLTNEIITFDIKTLTIKEKTIPLNDPLADEFFRQKDDIVYLRGPKKDNDKCLAVLLDKTFIGSPSSQEPFIKEILQYSDFVVSPGSKRNSMSVGANWGLIAESINENTNISNVYVLVGNALIDSVVRHRSNRPRVKIEVSLSNTVSLISRITENEFKPIIILPPSIKFIGMPDIQIEVFNTFRQTYLDYSHKNNLQIIDLDEIFLSLNLNTNYTEAWSNNKFQSALLKKIFASMEIKQKFNFYQITPVFLRKARFYLHLLWSWLCR